MWFSAKVVFPLLLASTVCDAVSIEVRNGQTKASNFEKRLNCKGGGNFVIYEYPDGAGGQSLVCVNGYFTAACFVLVAAAPTIFSSLASQMTSWVQNKFNDASSAGPQATRDLKSITWGQAYNYTQKSGSTVAALPESPTTATLAHLDQAGSHLFLTALELHEDGFSGTASVVSGTSSVKPRTNCYEQIHVHYWAASGHDSTVLGFTAIDNMMSAALSDAYNENYAKVCYEMTNNGNWDGFLRVCFNDNVSQVGCYTCGGHNN